MKGQKVNFSKKIYELFLRKTDPQVLDWGIFYVHIRVHDAPTYPISMFRDNFVFLKRSRVHSKTFLL